ncbi:MAG: YkoP family protein [Anaerolineae bacterium]
MRAFIKLLDYIIRRATKVIEYCDDPQCIFRVQIAPAPHPIALSDETHIPAGTPILFLHLWNEHIPPIPPAGPDLAWALQTERRLRRSLRRLAEWMTDNPHCAQVQAIGGITVLIAPAGQDGSEHLLRRLGFEIFPWHHPLGRFGEFWENLYTWWLMWTFNPASLRGRRLLELQRKEFWASREAFLTRYRRPTPIESSARRTTVSHINPET